MNVFDRIIIVLTIAVTISASYNAREAHKHTHEIGCHIGAGELCKWHEENK